MTDIQEIFQRDPLDLTTEDLTAIITKFRASRGQFNLGDKKAGVTKPPSAKQQKLLDVADKLKGFDLDL